MRSSMSSRVESENDSSTHEMEKDSEPVYKSLFSWNYFFGTIWYMILCIRIRQGFEKNLLTLRRPAFGSLFILILGILLRYSHNIQI